MKRFLSGYLSNPFVKVSSWTSLATAIKIGSGFLTVKVLAVYAGPEGMAVFGQLVNASTVFMTLATGAINTGVTKYIAEFSSNKEKQDAVIATAIKITFICSIVIGVILIVTSESFGKFLFNSSSYSDILRIFGLTIGLYAFNNLFISIINGYKAYKEYVLISVASSILVMVTTILLVYYLGTYGALLAYVTVQSAVIVVTLMVMRTMKLRVRLFRLSVDLPIARLLFLYSLATLTSAIVVPVSQIVTRHIITELISVESAGIWEGINRISAGYLMIITTSIQVYYLPRLSEIEGKHNLISEIKKTCSIVLPPLLVVTTVIFFIKDFIITTLFTKDFSSMSELFFAQLLGDFLKIASWLIAYAMFAKAMVKQFIITEIIFNFLYVILVYFFISSFGFEAISWAYCTTYLVYLFTVVVIVFKTKF